MTTPLNPVDGPTIEGTIVMLNMSSSIIHLLVTKLECRPDNLPSDDKVFKVLRETAKELSGLANDLLVKATP